MEEVFVTRGDALERIFRMIVFDKVVLDSGFLGYAKDLLPVDDSAAHFGHLFQRVAEILSAGASDISGSSSCLSRGPAGSVRDRDRNT